MHRSHLRLLLGVMIAGVSLIVAGAAGSAPGKKAAGTVIFGAEQEPPCLNGALAGCNNTWTSWTGGLAFPGAYLLLPDFSFTPYMIVGEAKITKRPFTVTYRINPKAKWSDGKPVTADDFIYTWQLLINKKNEVASTSGYTSIRRGVKINAKTVKFIFSKPYAPYKVLFSGPFGVYPKHALVGTDFNEVWNTNYNNKSGVTMASGPYKLQSYVKGQTLTLVRNPSFWGKRPSLDRITFRFITNTDSEVQAIRGGEVDTIYPQPQLQLAQLRGQAGLSVQSSAGAQFEHLDLNMGPKSSNPLLKQRWFRQAIAYSLNRQAMVTQLFRTLKPGLGVLNNLSYTSQQKGKYVPNFKKYTAKPATVAALFRSHGCTKGGDGIYTCAGQRASVRLGTTAGNKLRELAVEILQAQGKANGIEFRPDNQPSRLFFPRISALDFDIALYAWVGTGDPQGQVDIYGCADPKTADNPTGAGGSNWKGYCNAKVTNAFSQADAELNPAKRIKLVNTAEAQMAIDVPALPLYQKPTYFVFKTKLHNLKDNPTSQGPTWNTERWTVG